MDWGGMEMANRRGDAGARWRASARAVVRAAVFVAIASGAWLPTHEAAAQFAFLDPPRGHLERTHEFDLHADGEFGADLDDGSEFRRVNTGLRYTTDGALNRNFGLGLHASYTYDGYHFDDDPTSCSSPTDACFHEQPWKSIHTIDIAPSVGIIFSPGFQLLAWVPVRFSNEPGNSDKGVTGGIVAGARMVFAQGAFATTLGVGYMSELEDDGRLFPVIGVDWQFGERWRIETEGGPFEGGLGTLIFGPAESIKFRVSAGWERKRFRLSNAGARTPNGLGQQENAPLLAGIDLRLSDAFHFEMHGGLSLAGRLSVYDAGGTKLLESDYDVAGRLGASLRVTF